MVVAASPTRVWFWTYLHGVDDRYVQYLGSEDELNFRWYYQGLPVPSDPPISANIHGGWKVASYLVNLPGNWRVDLEINQNVVASKSFKVVAKAAHEPVGNFEFSAPTYHTTENREFAEIRVRRTGGARGEAAVFLECAMARPRDADYKDKSDAALRGWPSREKIRSIVDNPYRFAERASN